MIIIYDSRIPKEAKTNKRNSKLFHWQIRAKAIVSSKKKNDERGTYFFIYLGAAIWCNCVNGRIGRSLILIHLADDSL